MFFLIFKINILSGEDQKGFFFKLHWIKRLQQGKDFVLMILITYSLAHQSSLFVVLVEKEN
jgi:hypothetical protein